ncbi:MAG: ABC transporter ATP-binding protein, partial [Paracoccus sp. (in: a-proteobacteria)]
VARALASRPDLMLMDEPFGALDPIIRARAQQDLRRIQQALGSTIMLVTHDMEEAIHLGDRIAVMDKGRLVQHGTPAQIIRQPATDFVAEMVGGVERPLRLLSLIPVSDVVENGSAEGEAVAAETSLRDALAICLWTGREALPVTRDGAGQQRVTLDAIRARAEGRT